MHAPTGCTGQGWQMAHSSHHLIHIHPIHQSSHIRQELSSLAHWLAWMFKRRILGIALAHSPFPSFHVSKFSLPPFCSWEPFFSFLPCLAAGRHHCTVPTGRAHMPSCFGIGSQGCTVCGGVTPTDPLPITLSDSVLVLQGKVGLGRKP